MAETDYSRPDPDALLRMLKKEEEKSERGKLKIFFGMCAGVGKTYAMLSEARDAMANGTDVLVGYIETHNRTETAELLLGLPIVPRKAVQYRGTTLYEMDIDAVLEKKPSVVLVDELAHTNAPGSRHNRRYQDVLELLDHGIDVYTTLNVQHLESRADTVARITGSTVRETVPDSVFEIAEEIKVIDISPDDLLKRLEEGKVYTPERSKQAIQNFFKPGNLSALREMALRMTAERVDRQIREYRRGKRISKSWRSGQRFVVAISPSPHTVSVIRWARRVAYTMDASWIAVYVESSAKLSAEQNEQLSKNIKLARELGAEVITTVDTDLASALIRVAREQNASQILVGKPNRLFFSHAARLVDGLIQKSSDLDIYIVGQEDGGPKRKLQGMVPRPQSSPMQYASAAGFILLAALVSFPFRGLIGYRTVSFILLLVVILLPLKFGPGPTVLSAAIGALSWDFLFIPPRFTFSISNLEDSLLVMMFFLVAAVTGILSARIRKRESIIRQREQRTSALYGLTKDLSSAHSQDEVVTAAVLNIKKYFGADVAVLMGDTEGEMPSTVHEASSFIPDSKDLGVASWAYWNEKKAGKNTDTLPMAQATYYPLSGPRYPLGVIGVKLKESELSFEHESLLENFISQITSAIEREMLNDVNRKSVVVAESERLYKTLFNSISHEFRTPISTIMGVSENLVGRASGLRPDVQAEQLNEIHTAAERLDRLVANLLDMTRLESGMIKPRLDWCDIRDIIARSLKGLEKELEGHRLSVNLPASIPLMKLDFGLIEQALTNLIHNAGLYTPAGSEITIRASVDRSDCMIIIADNGPGLPQENLNRVFEKFYRASNGRAGGTGLGLTIARGFIEAHHGRIAAGNRPDGGAEFTVILPLPEIIDAAGQREEV